MVNFEYLNWQTQQFNNRNVTHNNLYSARDEIRRKNMETFKAHNGQYPLVPYK